MSFKLSSIAQYAFFDCFPIAFPIGIARIYFDLSLPTYLTIKFRNLVHIFCTLESFAVQRAHATMRTFAHLSYICVQHLCGKIQHLRLEAWNFLVS